MNNTFQITSPVDGKILFTRSYATDEQIDTTLSQARIAQKKWKELPLGERIQHLTAFVEAFTKEADDIAMELTMQMGRPIRYSPGEVNGFEHRASTMLQLASKHLRDILLPPKQGFARFIRREPLGVVFCLAPWNYPYLTAVNAIIPAMVAGNTVVLKHAKQTALCAQRLADAAQASGLPKHVIQILDCTHAQAASMVQDPRIDFVAFTGSVEGGRAIRNASIDRFIGLGLELGGKDPAYVREDADFEHAVENLVDGAFFNSGQSCCGIERIYVHHHLYDRFVEAAAEMVHQYRLGDPRDSTTNLGPMVRKSSADYVRNQIQDAVSSGAKALIDTGAFPMDTGQNAYLAPQILINVDHQMDIMREESFGPVVGIMSVRDDLDAISRMNDSKYGLTAAIWTKDVDVAMNIGSQLETGTVFMNRCDYLDPELAWVGVKDSGYGCTLSKLGFEQLTRPKSFHLRL